MIIEDTESFENVFVSNYWYDADGERTVKTSGENEAIYVNPYLVAGQGGEYTKHIYIAALGESLFPSSLAFPRLAKVIFRVVWHFRAGRKSFSEWFDACANRLFIKKLLLSGKPSPDIKVKGQNPLSDSSPFCYLCFCYKTSITWAKVHILSGNNS